MKTNSPDRAQGARSFCLWALFSPPLAVFR
jgi:hypothetical protein